MMSSNGLAVGAFPRYVGNRLHILFHLATFVVTHREILKFCSEKNSTIKNSSKDLLQDEDTIDQLKCLSCVGKAITGPWMTAYYSNQVNNLDMNPQIKASVACLEKWLKDMDSFVSLKKDILGKESLISS